MNRVFAYGRVSTLEQSTDNQLMALQQKGFEIQSHRWFAEQVSGGTPAMQRPEFSRMTDRMEAGDMLVVLKLDRLGRDVQDVLATIEILAERGIHVRSVDLDGVDLTSAAGKLQLTVLAAVAAFERDRIRERTKEGLARSDKKGGRPEATGTTKLVQACKSRGLSQSQSVSELGLSLPTIKRHWNK
ncbi:recombinase family protein [Pseudomonas sp. 21LCFQ010]|uniref:recombinase family protein n=1 Tax=Pseudomonas sp. 21LCFQ010 TaxID=2957506 RepID=UPI002096E5CD|nr:recombinase family protein [Pseudomonas sp. 21LCFQ010]MCO8165488.1 recombinase family protein [Pseudomonas sp. 21LCFQ010]